MRTPTAANPVSLGLAFALCSRCVVELFVFCEMHFGSSQRIEIAHFAGVNDYAPAACRLTARERIGKLIVPRAAHAGTSRQSSAAVAPHEWLDSGTYQLGCGFDVRKAICMVPADTDRLLGVVEQCGAGGADSFNAWMHSLLIRSLSPSHVGKRAR